MDRGREAGLIVFHSQRIEEIRAGRGEAVATHLIVQLADFVRPELLPGDRLGRLGADNLAVLMTSSLAAAQETAARLHRLLRENSRFPVSIGVANSAGLQGGAKALCELGLKAALEARVSGDRIQTRTAKGPVPLPEALAFPPAPDPSSTSLGARYQRLVLLNRMSLELFSERPFPEALASAANIILALVGAKHVSVYFLDDFGFPFRALRCGDDLLHAPDARQEEDALVLEALRERRILTSRDARYGWLAAPLLHFKKEPPSEDGVLVAGYLEAPEPSPERDQLLLEASRLLRGARLAQMHLQQQRTMAAVSEQSADAILLTNLDARILNWNPSAAQLFQYSREEAVGRPALLIVPQDKREELRRLEADARASGSVRNVETVCRRKDQSLVPVEATFTLLKDESGSPFGMVRVYRDITKRKEVERMKTEFVSLVSHELRTPLTAIRGFTETIFDFWDEITPEQRRHYLGIILEESKRLGKLVTDFLDISRLEAGGVELKPKELDLRPLCERLSALFKDHPSRAVFETRLDPDAAKAWGDEDQIYRVLVNLCGNALKYSPPQGAIAISSRRDGPWLEISVSDQGPGIARENQKKIFEKFYRVADPVSQKTPGTGLGLAICKGIVESHGGRIWVESEPGRGTSFKFTLGAEKPEP